jgi:hypothetical protein
MIGPFKPALDQVIHRFGMPNNIITDLGTQFTGNTFWDFCDERSIVVKYVSVAHPELMDMSSGLME